MMTQNITLHCGQKKDLGFKLGAALENNEQN